MMTAKEESPKTVPVLGVVVSRVEAELFINLLIDKARQIEGRFRPKLEVKTDGGEHANK